MTFMFKAKEKATQATFLKTTQFTVTYLQPGASFFQ